jgi:hypothetical protein
MTAADINKGVCPTKEESGVLMLSVCLNKHHVGGKRVMGRGGQ